MSDSSKYPKFIWVVVALILVAVVGFALLSSQPVQEVIFPVGGGVKFGPKAKEETVRFYVSYERDGNLVIEGQAVLHLSGAPQPMTLFVDRAKPFHTASITVPKPGTYAYRLEQVETHRSQKNREDVSVLVAIRGDGEIDVQPGIAFKIHRVLSGGEWSAELQGVRSEEERRKIRERSREELDKIIEGR